jgi:manganese transport protein
MYERILVTLDTSPTDRAVIDHVKTLAAITHSRVVLLHVADGWAARTYGSDAVSPEVTQDQQYLDGLRQEFQAAGIAAESELAFGEPVREILKWVKEKRCDLIAMTSHGHKIVGDIFLGSTIDKVRHNTAIPILVVRAVPVPAVPKVAAKA